MATCTGCQAPIFWLSSEKDGKKIPVDVDPNPAGNITIPRPGVAHVLSKAEKAGVVSLFDGETDRYTSHFATCPEAKHFKRCRKCHKKPCECKTTTRGATT